MSGLLVCSVSAHALSEMPLSKIEEAYWQCDYNSTKSLITFGDAEICSHVYEELKARKFGGDFIKLNEWWKANKAKEYSRLSNKK